MLTQHIRKIIVVFTLITVTGFAAYAFADPGSGFGGYGRGWGYYGKGGNDECPGYGRGWGPHGGYFGTLSGEEAKKLEAERNAFFDATKDLRQGIHQKRLELGAELAKREPDTQKAMNLQKEISDLKSQLDQKRLEHHIKMKESFPDLAGMGMRFQHRGYGPRGHHGGYW